MNISEDEYKIYDKKFDYEVGDYIVLTPEGKKELDRFNLNNIMEIVHITYNKFSKKEYFAYFYFQDFANGFSSIYFKKSRSYRINKLLKEI